MRIIIGADIVATSKNKKFFSNGEMSKVVGSDIYELLHQSDINIFNVEAPFINYDNPINKCGVHLRMDERDAKGLVDLNTTMVTLANNHILDHGQEGIINTIRVLDRLGISYVGAGNTYDSAACPQIISCEGIKIGVYACAEHEFSIISEGKYGANPFDPLCSFDHISKAKSECDFLIVLFHGGREQYRYPTPNLQRIFRKMAEKGANLIIAQHTHCIGAFEKYLDSLLVYGQGNFIFDNMSNEYWNSGLLVRIDINSIKQAKISFIPFVKKDGVIRMAHKNKRKILDQFKERSEKILAEDEVRKIYNDYSVKKLTECLLAIRGNSFLLKIAKKICGEKTIQRLYSEKTLLSILNHVECEAHNELMISGIKNKLEEKG